MIALAALLVAIAVVEGSSFEGLQPQHAVPFVKSQNNSGSSSFEGLQPQYMVPFVKSGEGNTQSSPFEGLQTQYMVPFVKSGTDQASQQENVSEISPSTLVYIGETAIPLSSYQADSGKYLWIEVDNGLSQYTSINQYATIPLLAYTSTSGPGEILEIYPSASGQGTYQRFHFNFNSGYNRIPYRGDVVGKHYLLFAMDDQPSNAIIIDVKGTGSPLLLGTAPSVASTDNSEQAS